MNKIFSLFIALFAIAQIGNATNYYVDGAKADDSGNGLSWATAKKTLNATISGSAAGDNIFVKAGTYTYNVSNPASATYALSTTADRNYYGGFAGTETDPSQRVLSDLDNNGIIESWEFSNPTILNITLDNTTNNNARGLNITSNTAMRVFDGFKITGSNAYNCTTTGTNILCISLNSFTLFRNNTVSDWTVSGTINVASYAMDALLIKTGGGAGVIDNCLFENNSVTINAGSAINSDQRQSPFIRLNNATASGANGMKNSIIRKNQVKVDYANSSTITACSNVRGMLVELVTATSPYYTFFKNNIVHNNDLTFVPRSGQTFSASNGAAVYTYTGTNTNSDSIANNTITKNKLVKMSRALVVGFSNSTQPYHVVANNVVYDNTNDGTLANIVLGTTPSGTPSGIYIANNISNGYGLDQTAYSGNSYVVNNLNDLATSNTDAAKGAKFASPSGVIGYSTDVSVATSRWTIGSNSYLKGKGFTTLSKTDKAGHLFATTPSVGAYEQTTNTITLNKNETTSSETVLTGDGVYDYGSSATISVTLSANRLFTNWSDASGILSANASYTFVVTKDNTITANLDINPTTAIVDVESAVMIVVKKNLIQVNIPGVVEVYNSVGRLVISSVANELIRIETPGVYIVRVSNGTQVKTQKVII